jgi:hypothetical protein
MTLTAFFSLFYHFGILHLRIICAMHTDENLLVVFVTVLWINLFIFIKCSCLIEINCGRLRSIYFQFLDLVYFFKNNNFFWYQLLKDLKQ